MAKYGVNKAILVGNLGEDPEISYLESGIAVARLRLATSDSVKTKEGHRKDRTEWHSVVLWRSLAEMASKYLKKGNTVYIEGRIITRSWAGQDGVTKYRTEIEAETLRMLGGAPQNTTNAAAEEKPKVQPPISPKNNSSDEGASDDLPF